MKRTQTPSPKTLWYGAAVIVTVIVLLIIITPTAFAQNTTQPPRISPLSRQYTELLRNVFNFVEENYVDDVDPKVLYEGAIKGMLDALGDPYTTYLDASKQRDMNDITMGSFGGVGLTITKPVESSSEKPAWVEVASPIEDTPGWKAGILAGDMIISINDTPTPDISMDEVLGMLRGPVGEDVELVIRRGKNVEFPVTLTRALIEVPTVKYGMINGNTGYLRIIEFTRYTPERVQDALEFFETNNYKGIIIDLRNNPGGVIDSVVAVADKFIDSGIIVSTKSRIPYQNIEYSASPQNTVKSTYGIPTIVLINKGSASASEILAGALKDYHLAYLVGETTYGKGSVQQVLDFRGTEDGIKITTARYYTPSDSNIDKTGIPADMEVLFPELTSDEEKTFVDLITSSVIQDYSAEHPDMSEEQISAYAKKLAKEYPLEERLLRRLIRQEQYRKKTSPLYDLDYDIQLQKALSLIGQTNFSDMVKSAETIRELQMKAQAESETAEAEE
ncbi:MAG: S41 family peptidase [Spirochaetaceae bacterium]|jgi:carboxyl-terminal processing protease|nr:S41 family peptidase [Spirochaetaceae bacterium]